MKGLLSLRRYAWRMAEPANVVQRIYANLARLLGGKAAAGLLSLVYMVIAARALGRADYGVLILVHAYVMTVAGIVEFPGWHAVVRYGADAEARGEAPRLTRLMAYAGGVELACGALAVAAAAALAPVVGPQLGWSRDIVAFALPYSLAALATVRATPAGYLQLKGRFDLLGAHSLVAPLVRLVGAGIAAMAHAGLRGFLIAWLVAALAEWVGMWGLGLAAARGRHSRRHLRGGLAHVPAENTGLWRFMLGANADVTLSELAGRLTPLAIGWVLGPAATGLYAIAQRATAVIAQPAQLLGQAAFAELAHLVAAGASGHQVRRVVLRATLAAVAAAAPVCLLLAVLGSQVAVLIGGPAFAAAGGIMAWLALARVIQLGAPPISAALTALGRPGLSAWANTVAGLAMVLLLPVLLDVFGLVGAGAQALGQAVLVVALLTLVLVQATEGAEIRSQTAEA